MFDLFTRLYPVLPCILITVTIFLCYNTYNKMKNYTEIEGEIMDFSKSRTNMRMGGEPAYSVSPIVEYTVNGQKYKYAGNFYSSSMKKGNKVKLMCDENNPEKVVIKTGLFFFPAIVGIMSLFSLIPIFIFRLII